MSPTGEDGVLGLDEVNESVGGGSGGDGGMRYRGREAGGCGMDWLVEVGSVA